MGSQSTVVAASVPLKDTMLAVLSSQELTQGDS